MRRLGLAALSSLLFFACNAVLGLDQVTRNPSEGEEGGDGSGATGGSASGGAGGVAKGGMGGLSGNTGGGASKGGGSGVETGGISASGGSEEGGETSGGQGGSGKGGASAAGGSVNGGNTNGGNTTTTGGVANAGTGGSANGGNANTGGATTGGTGAGGSASGGKANTGGATTGGTTGGTAAGGTNTGGKATGGTTGGTATGGSGGGGTVLAKFSFFVTSLSALRTLSGNQDGFGGDLRFGEATGLAGADKICTQIAEKSMPGSSTKIWRALLSTTTVNAKERIGNGPWYDRVGRVVSPDLPALFGNRPAADAAIVNDLPNEDGVPNHNPDGTGNVDNHDVITGTRDTGDWDAGSTCNDWTSAVNVDGPRVGHSWPRGTGATASWVSSHVAPGCLPGVNLVEDGAGTGEGIGNSGGYGGFYCFALSP